MAGAVIPVLATSASVVVSAAGLAIPVAGAAGLSIARIATMAVRPVVFVFSSLGSAVPTLGYNIYHQIKSEPPWLKSYGEYMGTDKNFEIKGGPHEKEVFIKRSDRHPYLVVDQTVNTATGRLGAIYIESSFVK